MKRCVHIFGIFLCSFQIVAQTFLPDYQTFGDVDIVGTARYVAMGGAFTALGGDVSAALYNPAALGVFRHGEVSATVDWFADNVRSADNSEYTMRFTIPQVAWIVNFSNSNKQKGLLSGSLMLQYHRLKSFARNSAFTAYDCQSSLTDLMADLTNGLDESALSDTYWYENEEVGTLSEVAYQLFLIDPIKDDPSLWTSVLSNGERVDNLLRVAESGSIDEYSLSWGGNISNRVYFGIGANLRSLNYSKIATYSEYFQKGGKFSQTSSVSASGIGFDATIGLIVIPVNRLRLGIAYQTPVWMTYGLRSYTDAKSNLYEQGSFRFETDRINNFYFVLPMRLNAGVAYQFPRALISLQYDWLHQIDVILSPDVHTIRAGAELCLKNNYFLRVGYATISTFNNSDFYFSPHYSDLRTDTDYKNMHIAHFASVGMGFRNRYLVAEMAYQFRYEKGRQYAFSQPITDETGYTDWRNISYDMNATTHRIVVTIAWTSRR